MEVIRNSGVYFLFSGNELVYIGQTRNLYHRLAAHIKEKQFDTFEFIEVDGIVLNSMEATLIDYFKPPLNINGALHGDAGVRLPSKNSYMRAARNLIDEWYTEKDIDREKRCESCRHFWLFSVEPARYMYSRYKKCPFERAPEKNDFCSRWEKLIRCDECKNRTSTGYCMAGMNTSKGYCVKGE